jgi:drug/metabolite transporter (DMT)-like permease
MRGFLRRLWDKPIWLIWVAPLIWSTNITIGRAVASTFPPASLTFLRWSLAALMLAPFVWTRTRGQMPLLKRHWGLVSVSGLLGMAAYSALAYLALHSTTAANVAFINSTLPLMVPIVMLFIAREPMAPRTLAGIFVSFCGVLWIMSRGDLAHLASLSFARGDLIALGAVASYAVYSVLVRKKPKELDMLVFLFAGSVVGSLILVPFVGVELAQGAQVPHDFKAIVLIIYIALVISLVAYIAWNRCIIALGPGIAGASYHLLSVFTPVVAYLALGEKLLGYHYMGIALILAGVFVATRRA